jgi:hypothetical protein
MPSIELPFRFNLTPAELAALKGDPGDPGEPGEKGDKGDKGDAGDPGSGSNFPQYRTIFIRTNGDDETAEIANPNLPFQNSSSAIAAYLALATSDVYIFDFGIGTFNTAYLTGFPGTFYFRGCGKHLTSINSIESNSGVVLVDVLGKSVRIANTIIYGDITANNCEFTDLNAMASGVQSGTGGSVYLTNCVAVTAAAGNGGNGATAEYPNGGAGGNVEMVDCQIGTVTIGNGGNGASGEATGGAAGTGGNAGAASFRRCVIESFIGGAGGNGDSGNGTACQPILYRSQYQPSSVGMLTIRHVDATGALDGSGASSNIGFY